MTPRPGVLPDGTECVVHCVVGEWAFVQVGDERPFVEEVANVRHRFKVGETVQWDCDCGCHPRHTVIDVRLGNGRQELRLQWPDGITEWRNAANYRLVAS